MVESANVPKVIDDVYPVIVQLLLNQFVWLCDYEIWKEKKEKQLTFLCFTLTFFLFENWKKYFRCL